MKKTKQAQSSRNGFRFGHRAASFGLVALVTLGAGSFAVIARSGGAEAKSAPSVAVAEARADAELALSYVAGSDPTGREIARAQAALKKAPDSAEPYVNLALLLVRHQRETSDVGLRLYAEDAIKAAKQRAPHSPRVLAVEAMMMQEQHRFREARDLAKRVIDVKADDPSGHILLGDALLELGDYDGAEAAFQQAMDIRPDLRSYERGGHVRWLHGDIDGAIELYRMALDAGSSRDPESSAWCWVELGTIELNRGDSAKALATAKRALDLVKDYAPALVLEARASAQKGDSARAIELLDRLTRRLPSAELLLELAELESAAGHASRAKSLFAEAERLGSREPLPMSMYLSRHRERPEAALELSRQELAQRDNVAAHDAHALALLRAGKLDEAKEAIDKALSLGTPDARFVIHQGLILAAKGERASARERLDRALKINPLVDALLVKELRQATALEAK